MLRYFNQVLEDFENGMASRDEVVKFLLFL